MPWETSKKKSFGLCIMYIVKKLFNKSINVVELTYDAHLQKHRIFDLDSQ